MIRRDFLKSATLLSGAAAVPGFLARSARAAKPSGAPGAKETVLVVIQLTGGNDGLNTLVPLRDPLYQMSRPRLGVPASAALKLTDDFGLHPAMAAAAKLYEQGKFAAVQGVGYPNPDQSHFRSLDIWQAGGTDADPADGWLGRALRANPLPAFHVPGGTLGDSPLALKGAPARVPSVSSIEDFRLQTQSPTRAGRAAQAGAIRAASTSGGADDLLDFVARTATDTYASSERLQKLAAGYVPKATYPNSALANRMKLAAQLIVAGTGARIFYLGQDGFDTHAGQGGVTGAHATLVGDLSGAVGAFLADLAGHGHGERVCVMTFSEFGRRVKENGSQGTDHGSGAPMLLVGGKVKAGVIGDAPSLTPTADGNLAHATDFRQVYAAVLGDWLGLDAAAVLGKGFAPARVFA